MRPRSPDGRRTNRRTSRKWSAPTPFAPTTRTTPSGLLKREMEALGSLVMTCARESAVPAGDALAVDREAFARRVTAAIEREAASRDRSRGVSRNSRPAESSSSRRVRSPRRGSPSRFTELLGEGRALFLRFDGADRDGRFARLCEDLPRVAIRQGRRRRLPELPARPRSSTRNSSPSSSRPRRSRFTTSRRASISRAAFRSRSWRSAGVETLRHGPLKPMGLEDPRTGRRPHAVVQLRQDDLAREHYNLVGFQTKLKVGEQKRIFRKIPGLENANFVRFGMLHRNTYIHSPAHLDRFFRMQANPRVFFAGQITGVEGYLESAATGLYVGRTIAQLLEGADPVPAPFDTALGSLSRHCSQRPRTKTFEPMNVTFGMIEDSSHAGGSRPGAASQDSLRPGARIDRSLRGADRRNGLGRNRARGMKIRSGRDRDALRRGRIFRASPAAGGGRARPFAVLVRRGSRLRPHGDARARDRYLEALKQNPSDVSLRAELADYLWGTGDPTEAESQMDWLVARGHPRPGFLRYYGLRLFEAGNFVKASEILERAAREEASRLRPALLSGYGPAGKGGFFGSERALRSAIEKSPAPATAHHVLGNLLKLTARPREAVAELRLAAAAEENSADAWLDLAQALAADGQRSEAEESCRRSIRLAAGPRGGAPDARPDSPGRKGKTDESASELAASRSLYDREEKQAEENRGSAARTSQGWVLLRMNRPADALAQFESIPGSSSSGWRGRAEALERLGRREDAIRALESAKTLAPDDHSLDYALERLRTSAPTPMRPLAFLFGLLMEHLPRAAARAAPCPVSFEDVAARAGISFRHERGATEAHRLAETIGIGRGLARLRQRRLARPLRRAVGQRFRRATREGSSTTTETGRSRTSPRNRASERSCTEWARPRPTTTTTDSSTSTSPGTAATSCTTTTGTGPSPTSPTAPACADPPGARARPGPISTATDFSTSPSFVTSTRRRSRASSAETARVNRRDYCDPQLYPPAPMLLFHNNGDGTFRDISESSGVDAIEGKEPRRRRFRSRRRRPARPLRRERHDDQLSVPQPRIEPVRRRFAVVRRGGEPERQAAGGNGRRRRRSRRRRKNGPRRHELRSPRSTRTSAISAISSSRTSRRRADSGAPPSRIPGSD